MGFLHIKARSLLPKMDQIRVGLRSKPEFVFVSETWLCKSVSNPDLNLSSYTIFWLDKLTRGGEVATFVKDHLQCSVAFEKSNPKQFDLLVLKVLPKNVLNDSKL